MRGFVVILGENVLDGAGRRGTAMMRLTLLLLLLLLLVLVRVGVGVGVGYVVGG